MLDTEFGYEKTVRDEILKAIRKQETHLWLAREPLVKRQCSLCPS